MRVAIGSVCAVFLLGTSARDVGRSAAPPPRTAADRIVVNDNRVSGGTLSNGVLTIHLEAREGEWRPDRDDEPSLVVHAFAEEGRSLSIPGPLIRVPEGTTIRAFVRNALRDSTLVVHGLSSRGAAIPSAADTLQIKPGVVREVRFVAGVAGTYYYWGTTTSSAVSVGGPTIRPFADEELSGAFIVDQRGTVGPPRDRVFVINLWDKMPRPGGILRARDVLRFTINGKTWPNTERLTYSLGDTIRFRVVNASFAPHPMHLHGFFFNVDSRGDGTRDSTFDPHGSKHLVVTERVPPGRTFAMTWVPDRSGYWLFHCHDNGHALRNIPLDGTPLPGEHEVHVHNHALEMMGGLVMGIEVRDRGVVQAAAEPRARRKLRLVARVDADGRGTLLEPAFGYVLQEGAKTMPAQGSLLPAPTIVLKRGEPVSITVVNQLPEATSVHWHGIELDSYYDGVADFSGHPGRIAPAIAPGDSFEARFTPPRSGTFIYHPHADELRQPKAGLSGAIVVLDRPETFDPDKDIVLLLTAPRREVDAGTIYINGTSTPVPRELRVGERYRLRIVDIHPTRPSMIARLLRDSIPVRWRAVAKDGMDLPADQATVRPAVQQMGNGETYDFELTPTPAMVGELRFTVWSSAGDLLVSMPIRVR